MATLNTSSNGPNITRSYQNVVNAPPPSGVQASSPTYGQWAVFTVAAPLVSAFQQDGGKESVLKVQSTGEGELVDLVDEFSDGRIQFAFVKVKDPNSSLPKNVLIAWCGEGVPERTKGYFGSHVAVVSKLLHGYHVQVTARSDADLTPERIVQKVADASGAKYSGGGAIPSSGGPPPVAKKPVFTPKSIGGGGAGFNPLGRSRAPAPKADEDADGWGADAPQVSRSQLEKVGTAYTPTKVNMAELTANKDDSTSQNDRPEVVRGAYQPVGKVDIAAIRAQARDAKDDRPTVVKGAYEPVGKVDIAAIRAKAQAGPPASLSPAATGASNNGEEEEKPKSLAERSAAFSSQPERLTSMPKPKVANKFAGASTFTGTKAPTPGGFGAKPAIPAPIQEEPASPAAGGVSSLKDRFSGAVPMGAPTSRPVPEPRASSPPPLDTSSKPNAGTRGVALPGLPSRPKEPEEEEEPTTQHQRLPSPPRVPRSPSPEPSESPVRIAMPAEDNEVELREGEYVTDIDMVDDDWWMGTNSQGERGLFPANYVELVEGEDEGGAAPPPPTHPSAAHEPEPEPEPAAASSGPTATALYDYEAAEDNELSFPEGATITGLEFPDEDWWLGSFNGQSGLFPANYVELDQ
ncbi:actin binding [Pyrenophora seminiperda CCB06]|uniref:Actin binding n=1 Tax=Pyrenophora seminiperda CCB06 TaxID=1302712 RepID=A0A3M7LXI4_9PLEO|nr:actin binding [Pyrenophora seminiperda CCB06]